MKRISINDYNKSIGILIDVRHPLDYKVESHHSDSINIYFDRLVYNHSKYLDKSKKYFITCHKGIMSKKVVKNLELLGYDVTLAV